MKVRGLNCYGSPGRLQGCTCIFVDIVGGRSSTEAIACCTDGFRRVASAVITFHTELFAVLYNHVQTATQTIFTTSK